MATTTTAKPVQVLSCRPRLRTTLVPKGDQDAGNYVVATRETEGEEEMMEEDFHLDVDERCAGAPVTGGKQRVSVKTTT